MHWYVIRTKPQQERRAEFHLRQLSVETFLPLLKQRKKVRRAVKPVEGPLFPRYFFARFDITNQYRAVSFARGVLNIVEFGAKPAEVSESLIEGIRQRLKEGYVVPRLEPFRKGQVVRIHTGPLAGLEAVFVREMSEQHRVLLLLQALGSHAKVTMDFDHIELPRAL